MSQAWGIYHKVESAVQSHYGPGTFVVDLTPTNGYSNPNQSPQARILTNVIEFKLEGAVRGKRFAFQ